MNQQQLIEQKAAESIIYKLDVIARRYNSEDYGLPVSSKYSYKTMVNAVEHILHESGMQGEGERLREEVERLRGERDSLRIAAEALLNGLSKEHSGGQAVPRSIHVILKIKALKEVLAPKPQTEQP